MNELKRDMKWWEMLLWDEMDDTWKRLTPELQAKIKHKGLRTKP